MKNKKYLIIVPVIVLMIILGVFIMRHISIQENGIAIIGGADGPTSVFIAGKLPGGHGENMQEEIEEELQEEIEEELQEEMEESLDLDIRNEDELFVMNGSAENGNAESVNAESDNAQSVYAENMDGENMMGKYEKNKQSYISISMQEAKECFETEEGYLILDVRREDEYETGHIPGAVLLPNESIGDVPPGELPDMEQIIFVYCRSGNRSKLAAEKLANMGYTNIIEIGGILDWNGEIEK